MPKITVTSGPAAGQSREVDAEIVIGRGDVDFVIDDPELSRRHTVVRPAGTGVVVEDLGSRNGTWVDGKRITEPITVSRTSTLRLGTSEIALEVAAAAATQVRAATGAESPAGAATDVVAEEAEPPRERPAGGVLTRLLPLVAVLFVAGVVALVILAETGDSTEKHSLSASLDLVERSQVGNKALLVGKETGTPNGTGIARIDAAFRVTKPGPITSDTPAGGKLTTTYDNGELTSVLQLTVKPQPDGSRIYDGRGIVTGGTGDYADASGSFAVNGQQEPNTKRIAVELRGSVEY
jgi:pSer/pThr/pTyr-binding forkhead associated (FHA) protein